MKVALLDLETNGLIVGDNFITEIGTIIVEQTPDHFGLREVWKGNLFLWDESYPQQSDLIVRLTGITDDLLKKEGVAPLVAATAFITHFMVHKPDAIVAHNKGFDERFFKHLLKWTREKVEDSIKAEIDYVLTIPWICSMNDLLHPKEFKCKKLSHLCLDYGVVVDPKKLHRAIGDLEIMKEMLEIANVDFAKLLGRSLIPDVYVKAVVPKPFGPQGDGGVGKDKAKELGFQYEKIDDKVFPTTWVKKVKENEIEQLKKELGYEIRILA